MSRMLELPDPIYAALEEAASSSGLTPAGWIAAHLPQATAINGNNGQRPALTLAESGEVHGGPVDSDKNGQASSPPPQTLADFLEGHIGVINCPYPEPLSENPRELFTDYLEAKRRAGRL